MDDQFAAGRDFILREGRLLERRLFATCFEGAPATGVVDAVRAFRNDDGGFGHGLEPDVRCPASLPVDVEVALQALVTAKASDRALARSACDYLAKVAAAAAHDGAVPPAFPVIEGFPRAAHWSDWTYEAGLNPTAGLVGLLTQLGVEHPWVDEATAYCWAELERPELPAEAHALSEVMVFLEQMPANERSQRGSGQGGRVPGLGVVVESEPGRRRLWAIAAEHRPPGRQPVAQAVRRKGAGRSPGPRAAGPAKRRWLADYLGPSE